jgi:dTDP-glucose 4,6-dehydratase
MMKVLVTGGCGFIGSNFIRYILREHPDWQIVNLDKLTYAGNLANLADIAVDPRYKFIKGDIADRELVDKLFREEKFDAVVNFAAESHVDRSILDASPFIETNVKGTQVLLEAARQYAVDRFIQISTDEVYGSLGEAGKFTEESPLQPNSPYAASKAAADMLCRAYHRAYGLPIVITRSSNNYGPYQFPEKLIPLMIRNALIGKELPVYGEGKQVRDWLYVEDNCRAIDLVLQRGRAGEIYNIGGGCEKRNIEVVQLICDILKNYPKTQHLRPRIQFIRDPRGAAHDFRYALDCTKVKEELSWEPRVPFEAGLRRTVEWYLENEEWVESVITGEYREYYRKIYGSSSQKAWREELDG